MRDYLNPAVVDRIDDTAYVLDESQLISNLQKLRAIQESTDCKILLAQKAFSMFHVYPLISQYLAGTTASGLFEAKLAHEFMAERENHIFSPAFKEADFPEIIGICKHIVFNSAYQYQHLAPHAIAAGCSVGIRINPEISTQEGHAIYDPCAPGSRLGITIEEFERHDWTGLEGLHFHTLCEQNSDDLAKTLDVVEANFGKYFSKIKWLNFGGGHHITREDYDIELLLKCIRHIKTNYHLEVYLEPGEAVALNAGYLVTTVLDITENHGIYNAILDTSATCHMPDVLEMPYRPRIITAGEPGEKAFTYRLGGPTCLAGDIIGDYSFDKPLNRGDKLVFCDMAIYSMVKNNTFNGMPLPSIMLLKSDGSLELVKSFGYADFRNRLS